MPEQFKSFDVQITVSIVVKGSDYEPADWGNEEEFRQWAVKEAAEGMRNVEFDIGDCWLNSVEEVTP